MEQYKAARSISKKKDSVEKVVGQEEVEEELGDDQYVNDQKRLALK